MSIPPGPSTCPVTEIPSWYWRAVQTTSMIADGLYTAESLTMDAWGDADVVAVATHRATTARKQADEIGKRDNAKWGHDLRSEVERIRAERARAARE